MKYRHVVYLIEFAERKARNELPYYYIGSKSDCVFDGVSIIDKNGKPYYGSSKALGYAAAVEAEIPKIFIIDQFDNYQECIETEAKIHVANNVLADCRYWNLSIAAINDFSAPGLATVKHSVTGKVVRLPVTHEAILSGEFVGVSKGFQWYTDGANDVSCLPEHTPEGWFAGRSNTENFIRGDDHYMRKNPLQKEDVMTRCETRNKNMSENPEKYAPGKERQRRSASLAHKGIPKSLESNIKRARPGLVMLKNHLTGECVRIPREQIQEYDLDIWKNPYSLSPKRLGSKWYNNGIKQVKIYPGDQIPEGFKQGRKPSNKKATT